jgi:hypothetical protein
MKKCLIFIFLCVVVTACTYRNKEDILKNMSCNTTNITYTNTIKGILQSNGCEGCHAVGSTPPTLIGYDASKAAASQASFIGCLKHIAPYSPMPKNGNKIDSCSINKIEAWIAAGSPQ